MAEMVCSALAQETVSRGVFFVLGKREEKASQGHLMERLQMAVSELEFALEKAKELPIRHLSLLSRRKQFKLAFVEAMELLDRHNKQQAVSLVQEHLTQGAKRKRWVLCSAKNKSVTSCFAAMSTDDVRRYEWFADRAGKFVRDVESGCSLHHNTFGNPIVRHLLEGKTLKYYLLEQGNLIRGFYIWPVYSDERGVEAVLQYQYGDSTMTQKYFLLLLFLRLSASTDIVGVAMTCLQLLKSEFKIAAERAMGELTQLSISQDISHSYQPPYVGTQDWHSEYTEYFRPDPACCEGSRHRLCANNNNVSSELLSDIFPEQVICWAFKCCYVPALKPSRSSCSPFDVVGRSKSRGSSTSGKPHLLLSAVFAPHHANETQSGPYAHETIGDDQQYRDASLQQAIDAIKSDTINCFFCQPELTKYKIFWGSKYGGALFWVKKASMERAGAPKTRRRYNTRGSTRRSRRR